MNINKISHLFHFSPLPGPVFHRPLTHREIYIFYTEHFFETKRVHIKYNRNTGNFMMAAVEPLRAKCTRAPSPWRFLAYRARHLPRELRQLSRPRRWNTHIFRYRNSLWCSYKCRRWCVEVVCEKLNWFIEVWMR